MKILLLYPQYPETFWSFKHALKIISKEAFSPPLGLLTIASILPEEFEKKLIDLNTTELKDEDLLWADYVFISAMITQKNSVNKIVEKCKKLGIKIVAGGALFTSLYKDFPDIDHFVLNEGEITLPLFLEDFKNNNLKRVYTSEIKPDIKESPIPQWDLINFKKYSKMSVQFSRGCPFDCEFCDIVNLNGKIPRTKEPVQVIRELESLYQAGWRSSIFLVDDNFIGNKIKAKELLKALIEWKHCRKIKFTFTTEVSLNLADDEELMQLMKEAGFDSVFIGIETPSKESLTECGKYQNENRDLIASVRKIQNYGMVVSAGFIVGFDSDDISIFSRQIEFIQKTGVVVAMVGLLNALPGTRLYERLKKENRILEESSGNNTDFSTNFLPKMDMNILLDGYKNILSSIYSPENYFQRVKTFLEHYNPCIKKTIALTDIKAFIKSMFLLGIIQKERKYFWKIFFFSLFKYPKAFPNAVTMAVYYIHFRNIFTQQA